jgi:ABC-2 type transport system permease protein
VVVVGLALFLLISVGLGLLVSLISRTRQQAQQALVFIMIPTMVLSGFIFPIESMPEAIQPLTYAVPLRYALTVLRGSFVKGSDFGRWPNRCGSWPASLSSSSGPPSSPPDVGSRVREW